MKKKTYIVLMLMLALCLIASIIINIVSISTLKKQQIMDYNQIGLSDLIESDVTESFVDEGNNPNLQGVFDDPIAVEQLCSILASGCYQRCSPITNDSAPGSNSFPFIRLKTVDHTYAIAVLGDRVRITIDGESKCYFSNIQYETVRLINSILESHFIK